MNARRWSLALLGDDTSEQDDALSTDQTIEDDTDQSVEDTPDDDTTGGGDPPSDNPEEPNPEDNPLTDLNVPPEDRPRPEDLGLSTDKVVEESEKIRKDEELEQAKEDK